MTLRVSVHDDVPADAARIVDDGLGASNERAAPIQDVRRLSCIARDAAGAVIGGAIGRTWGRCCELQQFWVEEANRGRGLGTRLLEGFEARARERGCTTYYLDTFSFQAPALYEAFGYRIAASIEGYAPGVVKYLMVKHIGES